MSGINRIRELRKTHKMNQIDLAKKMNVSSQVISNWERGYTELPSNDLKKLSEIFNVSADYLLGRENNKVSTNAMDIEYKEFESFFSDPNNRIHFREMAESPEEMREKLWEYWDLLKKAQNNKL